MPVIVRLNDDDALEGRISAIHPKIENGVMTFTVTLVDKSNHLLRSNQRVDVLVVLQRKARALRLKKGPFAEGDGYRQAFVVRGDRAVKHAHWPGHRQLRRVRGRERPGGWR